MKNFHILAFLLLALCHSACKKFSSEHLNVSGKLIHPYTSEIYPAIEVQLMRKKTGNDLEFVTSIVTNSEGNFTLQKDVPEGDYCLKVPSLEGTWRDENNQLLCNPTITEASTRMNYFVSRGEGSVQFEISRMNESEEITDVEITFEYPNSIPGIQLTRINLFSITLLENLSICAPTGEAIIHLKFKTNGHLKEQWLDVTILKDQQITVHLLI